MDSATMFDACAAAFLRLLARIGAEQWGLPGLGVWDVRGLAGHTARAILTVETYLLADEPEERTIADALDYYAALAGGVADPSAVALRGEKAGRALGERPAEAVADAVGRASALIARQRPGRLVAVGGQASLAIELGDYLRTRVLELVVHTLDLSRATGIPAELPPAAIESCCALVGGLAARAGRGEELLLALTGRTQLAEAFSVV
ncbi:MULTISPECIES: maleylpyruvate isomerase N-terminal domain-containing protein [unclassified Rathayibacter]|uniref:maleylpyruvate isomerase N-terminal domain-containing protein n=1 Tax=unclassified Rathayibacter TaxID=2609250 RepID=UPI00188C3894|nr:MULTISPECIES: maleylpyruvate isomerase N-terminal domain-containing protein [unclassified Rathayibacter]MBF4460954.1 maleylpyruvate isomerase N-terminal domain-containing protein [Rathayibacter sp. VKM Ac-2879]MBF4502365.1 maleylpyruvate isomerase N-terminal domain-containing protein [Rathayibacter sp. VKM Ac-2878]